MIDVRISRLPKWAQSHIENQARRIAYLEEQLAVGPEDSDTFVDGSIVPDRPLGSSPRISYRLGDRDQIWVRTDREYDGTPHLMVMGAEELNIKPQSSNVVRIYGGTRRRP